MTMLCSFIPDNRTANLLCELFASYRAGRATAGTLIALREQLGAEEFANFEADLAKLMKKRPAWKAVEAILVAALTRKREALPGVAHRRDEIRAARLSLGRNVEATCDLIARED